MLVHTLKWGALVLEVVGMLTASCFGQLKGITITTVTLTSGILEGSFLAHTVGQLGALLITKSIRSLIVDLTQGDGGFGGGGSISGCNGGGGSYNTGAVQENEFGVNVGHGIVVIARISD